MRVTPLDIRHKEFSRAVRGYKDSEVDEFLDEITEEFERLFNENIDHKEKLEVLEEKISHYQNIEDTLQKTLISAQQQAEELKQNAQKEGDLILRDAELKTRSIVNDAYAERQKIQRSVQALKQKHEDMRYQLRKTIETYANILDQDMDTLGEMAEMERIATSAGDPNAENLGVDGAISQELLSGSGDEAGPEVAAAPVVARMDENVVSAPAGSSVTDTPPLKPAAMGEPDDPFADVEIDTEENRFHW